jgi:hypothetical protein
MLRRFYGNGNQGIMNLEVNIGKLRLKNPVMTASGTFGYGEEYSEFIDLNKLGAVVVKGIFLLSLWVEILLQGYVKPPAVC